MKQKILMTFVESGYGHISSMEGVYNELVDGYSDKYDIEKSFIMREDGFPHLMGMERFITKQVENTNKCAFFGKFVFPFIGLLGGHKLLRFFHRQLAHKSFKEGLEALRLREPNIIITNHYFTDLLAVEYKRRIDPTVVVVNYNPDNTLHSFWDARDGVFIVNNKLAFDMALKYGFKRENLRQVTPCVRKCVEENSDGQDKLRDKFSLPRDKFTVVVADGAYMCGRGPKFARALIKSGLPITVCIIAGKNEKKYNYFKAIEEGRGRIKVKDDMTVRVYPFLQNAHELYGAADVFVTKGGPNAVLDSIYMHTPVVIDYCPHVIEEATVKVFVKELGCGETAFNKRKLMKRIRAFMQDDAELFKYYGNIDKLVAQGNGASAIAEIIDAEARKQRNSLEEKGVVFETDADIWRGAAEARVSAITSVEADRILVASKSENTEYVLK